MAIPTLPADGKLAENKSSIWRSGDCVSESKMTAGVRAN
jgi:hypothetical protein